ncbi:MAG: tetratricopeptide repeat protein [Terricaulis sp.]
MPTSTAVFLVAALLTAAAAFWVLRAYRLAGGGAGSPRGPLATVGVFAVIALGAYLAVGRPELPDAPFRARLEALKHRDPSSYTADEALAVLDQAAREHPNDARPYYYSGLMLLQLQKPEEAARAFDAALRRDPRSGDAALGLGRALVTINHGRVTPEALQAFRQAGTLTNDPAPWIYQAMSAMQSNNEADARRFWGEALTRMSPDDPRREMARRMSTGH